MSSSLEPHLDLPHSHTLHAHAHTHTKLQAYKHIQAHMGLCKQIHSYIDTLIYAHIQACTGMHTCRHIIHAHRRLSTCPLSQVPTFILSCVHTQTRWFRPVLW